MKEQIHIALNIDSNYVKHCAVTLASLFDNNKEECFVVHILENGLTHEHKELLQSIAAKANSEVMFYEPEASLLSGLSIRKFSKRISMATYYRCLLSEIIPQEVDKLLYLDCDIVIMDSIRPLWELSLEGVGVAAVEDVGYDEAQRYDILKYPKEDSYFNAGMLLINMDYWRRHDMAHACINYFNTYPERILFNDQDLLNSILHKDKLLIDLKWNVQDGFYRNKGAMTETWKNKYAHALKHPVILHYTNRKPWEYDSQHPLRHVYTQYIDLTPWKGWRPLHNPLLKLKRFFRLLPFTIHLRKSKYINLSQLD